MSGEKKMKKYTQQKRAWCVYTRKKGRKKEKRRVKEKNVNNGKLKNKMGKKQRKIVKLGMNSFFSLFFFLNLK